MSSPVVQSSRTAPIMRALVFDGSMRLGQLPRPNPSADEVLVRIRACAISRSDIDMAQGRRPVQVRPVVLGHQFIGDVEEAGDDRGARWLGRRIVARTHSGCGRCIACREERAWLCETNRSHGIGMGLIDGAFAEWMLVPMDALVDVPDGVDDEEAVFAHPVALAREAIAQVEGPAPQRVLVVGDGNMGLLLTFMLHAAGHSVTVFGRHPSRRELLWRSGIGFTGVSDLTDPTSRAAQASFARESFGTVFECSGRVSGFDVAAAAVRPRGRLVLVSDHRGQPGVDLRFLVDGEAEIVGVSSGPLRGALDYLSRKTIDILPLVSLRSSLVDGVSAFEQAARRGTLKVILRNEGAGPGGRA